MKLLAMLSTTEYSYKSTKVFNYGLPQAALLTKLRLDAQHGYHETHTPCLYKHDTRPIMFTLVVDDFGIKDHGQEHLDHLLTTLRQLYTIKTGDGTKYLGITLSWDYTHRTVAKSTPGHLAKNLKRFNLQLHKPRYSPGGYIPPQYGTKAQQMAHVDDSPPLDAAEVVGVFLYYAKVIDNTMLKKITELGSLQATATTNGRRSKSNRFLTIRCNVP